MPIAVLFLTVVTFLPVLRNDFVNWDDDEYILDNPHVRGLGWSELRWMWTESIFQGLYRPLTLMTYGADYWLWGTKPSGYHLTSLILHSLNTLAFYFVAKRLLGRVAPPSLAAVDSPGLRMSAGAAALIFSVHPLRVEPVAWVSARADLVSGLFFLLSVLTYLKFCDRAGERGHRLPWQLASIGFFALAVAAKSSVLALPAVLMVLDIYPLRRLGGGTGRWFGSAARRVWLEKVPYGLIALPVLPAAFLSKRYAGAAGPLEQYDPVLGVAKAFFSIPFHLWKTLVPFDLSPLYQSPPDASPFDVSFLLSAVGVIAISVTLVACRRRGPAVLAVWSGYLILLLPASGFLSFGPHYAADRYTYLSCLGWAVLAAGGVLRLWTGRPEERSKRVGLLVAGLTGSTVALLMVLSWSQTHVWRSSEALWSSVLALDPSSSFAHNNMGLTVSRLGRWDEAIDHYNHALRIAPALAEAHNNLGLALGRRGEREAAIGHYLEALRLKPTLDRAHFNLGNAFAEKGEWSRAAEAYGKALALRSNFAEAQNNLGVVLMRQGQVAEAIPRFRQALQIRPGFREAQGNLDVALGRSRP